MCVYALFQWFISQLNANTIAQIYLPRCKSCSLFVCVCVCKICARITSNVNGSRQSFTRRCVARLPSTIDARITLVSHSPGKTSTSHIFVYIYTLHDAFSLFPYIEAACACINGHIFVVVEKHGPEPLRYTKRLQAVCRNSGGDN